MPPIFAGGNITPPREFLVNVTEKSVWDFHVAFTRLTLVTR